MVGMEGAEDEERIGYVDMIFRVFRTQRPHSERQIVLVKNYNNYKSTELIV